VKIDLEEHLSTEVMRAVQEGAADIGICNPPPRPATSCRPCPTGRTELVLIVPRGHALAAQGGLPSRTRWTTTTSACTPTARSTWRCAKPRPRAARIRLRIHVTGLDAMCRMITTAWASA
jgi:DNA-binding transcriptional LysR family regulator